ncbi:PHD finger protein 3 isoform X3 [Oryzias melastigma]|uniref:PHD finger protein 3 isoform X3 n=1 Tax=Oryzias melastigma TaxID=30732 RepID=UPI000CF8067B|nr:PHD finger protein 3 isoform X3 [Oryzias melastigma]
MDIVDPLSHLIPSDQLDESLVIGQNLESEASNEFRPGHKPEDSLKNMLSDKDPMFGCANTQFNLLDHEDPAFQIADSAGPDSGSTSKDTTNCRSGPKRRMPTNSLIRGKPGRKPVNRLRNSFLIEKGVKGPKLKKELTSGGRINIHDLDGGSWLSPAVVLRRLTVTIGGFKIELLPGPSYMQSGDISQLAGLDETMYQSDIGLAMLPDAVISGQNPISESIVEMDPQKSDADEVALGLGPYVNPNDVQTSNGTCVENPSMPERKHEDPSGTGKQKPGDVKHPHRSHNNTAAVCKKTEDKEKRHTVVKTTPKAKPGPASSKNKDLVPCKTSIAMKDHKVTELKPSKSIERADLHKLKSPKDKMVVSSLKRPSEVSQSEHTAKVQKVHGSSEVKTEPKSPVSPTKKIHMPGSRAGDHQGSTKSNAPHHVCKVEPSHQTHNHPGNSLKPPQEAGSDNFKLKKLEKILQRQKSRNSRSISVEEPQLFVPDNAPAVKKEAAEEQPVTSESVWDGNNCCGLCKKHHNNMFMVGCGRCDDWFHGDCVGLDLAKVREMEEEDQMYVCLKCCEEESKKVEPEPQTAAKSETQEKTQVHDHKLPPRAHPGSSQTPPPGGVKPVRNLTHPLILFIASVTNLTTDSERRHSTGAREVTHKTGAHQKHETKNKPTALASKKPVSVDAIRRSVRDSLKEILTQRLKESDLHISVERASEVAKKTEKELFHLFKDTDHKYKNKYRSLIFNLKDTKNNVLFKRVLKGEISPANLIRMSPEELASKELAAWRQRENRHTIEMIEKEQREVERRPITKITHKGEIEIESQEPLKVTEPVEIELPPVVTEVPAETPKSPEKKAELIKKEKDTTSQHKSHLFDLHCKICTGRMAPPAEEGPSKAAKVATTVVRRQSTKTEEAQVANPPAIDDDLHLTVLEESFRNAKSGLDVRSDHASGRDEEAAFLSNLKPLWRGFIHMHSVAKLVTRAFPVSGALDNLTEDLPDSIQVGGRISPQTVWDYLEKIRATGTKEVCLVRFTPETEEDEISYTLLYAYFSSRKRFGVVSNNLKQVKDMYLIPLGSVEKVPHQLVPFDGPGLENNRSNLLLGLLIRQRPKREFLPVDVNESVKIVPETKPITVPSKSTRETEEEEKHFLSSLMPTNKKDVDKPLDTAEEESVAESFEESSGAEEPGSQEPLKPLRFLPGVLVGWGGELPPLPDFSDKPMTAGDEAVKIKPPSKSNAVTDNAKGPTAAAPRFVIKKKEAKPNKTEAEVKVSAPNNSSKKDSAVTVHHASVTLKDKPPDVSTEAFLAGLSAAASVTKSGSAVSTNSDASLLSESEKPTEGNSSSQSQAALDHTNSSKPPLSGILKKSAYSSVQEDKTMVLHKDKASLPNPSSPKAVPVSSIRSEPVLPFHQGYLQLSQARTKDQNQTALPSFLTKKNNPGTGQPAAAEKQTLHSATAQAEGSTEASGPQNEQGDSGPLQEQLHGSSEASDVLPSDTSSTPQTDDQQSQNQDSQSELSGQSSPPAKDHKHPHEQYSDPWERPRNSDDRDHYGRHGHNREPHHGKKSRHHDREKKHDYSHEDKYRDRSRHHGHSDDRRGERRKERYHGEDHSSRHKDRHHHRRESEYENSRRSYS